MAESKLTQHASVKRKVYQWLLKIYRDDALDGLVQGLDAVPDVGDLVELLRGAGYRLSAVDMGANSSTMSVNGSTSTLASAAPGCQITIKCPRSGLGVTMESAGAAECRCPDTPAEDHSASTWSVVSSQENSEAVGSSLLPPVPGDVSDVVASTVRCAVRVLREWPSAKAPASLAPLATPLRPAPPPPPAPALAPHRPMSAEGVLHCAATAGLGGRLGERRPHFLSLDAAQWSTAGAGGTPTPPLASPWSYSASPIPTPTPPHSRSPLPAPDVPERSHLHRPRHSHSPPRTQSQSHFPLPQRSRSEEPPPVPPRRSRLYTLDDYLAMKAEKMHQEQQDFSRFGPARSQSVNDINVSPGRFTPASAAKKWGVSEPPSLTTLQETKETRRQSATPTRPLIAVSPKGTKVIINDATDFVTKAEMTMRQIGVLMQSIKKWMIAGAEQELTEPLVKTTANDTTESESSEGSVKKQPSKGSGKKGVKKLLPTLSSKAKAAGEGTPRPSGPAARVSDMQYSRLSRIGKHTFLTKAVVEAVPTRTFVRPKKKDQSKNAGTAAVVREPPPSGSEGSESGGSLGRRRTIASSTLPVSQRQSGPAQPRGACPRIGPSASKSSRAATTSVATSTTSLTSSEIRPAPTSAIRAAASSAANVVTSIAAHVAFNAAARARVAEAKSKGAVPRLPRHSAESRL